MKVSVLVAVYNAGPYLRKCLDSLVNQTHRDIQIICVDDASTDDSWQLLEEYAAKDERIVLLRQSENRGQAEARNRGLQVAEGEYITMLDSDDWFSPDAIESACRMAREEGNACDCVLFDLCYHDDSTGSEWGYAYRTEARHWTGEEAFRLSLDWSIHGLYMVRREIHLRHPYDTGSRLYSDDNTTRLHYLDSRSVARCEGVYFYRQHAASMTHTISPLRFLYLDANYTMKQTLVCLGVADEIISQYEHHRWLNLVGLCVFYWTNRRAFTSGQQREICQKLLHFHSTIEAWRLPASAVRKFGYWPLSSFPRLFLFQTRVYTALRRFFYRLSGKELPEA